MPELPEVETVTRGLRLAILGRRILSVTLAKTDFIDDPVALEVHLPGRRIEAVERFGKFMFLRLSGATETDRAPENGDAEPAFLLVHLGMTGRFAPSRAEQPREKHTHISLLLDDGRELRYTDARRFGRVAYLTEVPLAEELTGFGADPLEVSSEEFTKRICGRRARIKALLLDQMNREQAETLRRALQEILRKAIALRGSSISDFLDAEGEPGEYQRHHRAYGREGKCCYRCKTPIRRAIVAGRSSYFCPKCQPSPRGFCALPLPRHALPQATVKREKRRKGARKKIRNG